MKFIFAFLFGLGLVNTGFCADSFKQLASIHDFAFGGIGYAGTTSEGEILFRRIYTSESAEKQFRDLLKDGNIQAKCYALVALRKLDPKFYKTQIDQFKKSKKSVSTIGGCMIMVLPMCSVSVNIDNGTYDSYLPHQ
jgi:hypothetical protein